MFSAEANKNSRVYGWEAILETFFRYSNNLFKTLISPYILEVIKSSWLSVFSASVRTMLEAIISFLPSEGAGSIGSLEYSKAERQKLAKEVSLLFIWNLLWWYLCYKFLLTLVLWICFLTACFYRLAHWYLLSRSVLTLKQLIFMPMPFLPLRDFHSPRIYLSCRISVECII